MHTCAIQDCGVVISDQMLMCRWHWKKVPFDLATALVAAWNAFRRDETGSRARYVKLRNECVAAVTQQIQGVRQLRYRTPKGHEKRPT